MSQLVETIFSEEMTKKGLADLRKKYPKKLKVDMKDDIEFKKARKTKTERNKLVESVKRRRLDITKELKDHADGLSQSITDIFDVVIIPFDKENAHRQEVAEAEALKAQELLDKEQKEIEAIGDFLESARGKSSDEISGIIEAVDLIEVDVFSKDLIHVAMDVKKSTVEGLALLLSDTVAREKLESERAEIAKEREIADAEKVLQDRINALKLIPTTMFGKSSKDIGDKLEALHSYEITQDEFGRFYQDAKDSLFIVVGQLDQMRINQYLVEKSTQQNECETPANYKINENIHIHKGNTDQDTAGSVTDNQDHAVDLERHEETSLNPFNDWYINVGQNQQKQQNESGESFKRRLCELAYNAGECSR